MKSNTITRKYRKLYLIKTIVKQIFNLKTTIDVQTINKNDKEKLTEIDIFITDRSIDPFIQNLFKKLKPFNRYVDVYLHGSWADNTKTPFSDIDDFIILKTKLLKEKRILHKVCKILNDIDMRFCRIDPIQHHGHWICSKDELENYNNSFMPCYILKNSKLVFGNSKLKFNVNLKASEIGFKKNIISTCNGIEKLSKKYFDNSINAYQLKELVGCFALIPAFIMQAKGLKYNKPEAIKLAHTIFSDRALQCVVWSTNNRDNWGFITNKLTYKLFNYLTFLFTDPFTWRKFSRKNSPMVDIATLNNLSSIKLTHKMVNVFILESLKYAK
jgi:predicted nucleotidyltransferase